MASSVVAICNLGLIRVGHDRAIQALAPDETSKAANLCAMLYEPMRDKVLRAFAWPFANRYTTLNLVETSPNTDWGYSYRWPSDCIRPLKIATSGGRIFDMLNPAPYEIGSDTTGKLIFTDQASAVLKYTVRFTDPSLFDADFVDTMGWLMAYELASPMARGDFPAMRERALKEYLAALSRAEATAANEGEADPMQDAEHIRARE